MVELIPIQYHDAKYPEGIAPSIYEVAGHFDIVKLRITNEQYSLHTEYSYGSRKFDTELIKRYPTLVSFNRRGVAQLWHSKEWANDFANFIIELCHDHQDPDIIEIHPPFSDYSTITAFLECYSCFEERILFKYPKVKILLENRYGTLYRGGRFIVSYIEDLIEISSLIDSSHSNLRLTVDLPQLLTAHGFENSQPALLDDLFDKLKSIRHNILGIHLWGKRKNPKGQRVAHSGDLNSFFNDDDIKKTQFLCRMIDIFDDGVIRYFVPEVNSGNEDLNSIIKDMEVVGFTFSN